MDIYTKQTKEEKLAPIWYAIASIFVVPVTVIFMVIGSLLVLVAWPFIPFILYFEKRKENENTGTDQTGPSGSSES